MLHIKTLICTRIPIPKQRLAVFIHYPSVTKDQTLRRNSYHLILSHGSAAFNPASVIIEDTITCHDVVKG